MFNRRRCMLQQGVIPPIPFAAEQSFGSVLDIQDAGQYDWYLYPKAEKYDDENVSTQSSKIAYDNQHGYCYYYDITTTDIFYAGTDITSAGTQLTNCTATSGSEGLTAGAEYVYGLGTDYQTVRRIKYDNTDEGLVGTFSANMSSIFYWDGVVYGITANGTTIQRLHDNKTMDLTPMLTGITNNISVSRGADYDGHTLYINADGSGAGTLLEFNWECNMGIRPVLYTAMENIETLMTTGLDSCVINPVTHRVELLNNVVTNSRIYMLKLKGEA